MNAPDRRTSFERAYSGFDPDFERVLVEEITRAIGLASIVTDANVMALRTGETVSALANVLATVLALCPDADVPSRLRERVDEIARRIRRDAARARAAGVADILGAGREGHA
jgi:hypothetical protein